MLVDIHQYRSPTDEDDKYVFDLSNMSFRTSIDMVKLQKASTKKDMIGEIVDTIAKEHDTLLRVKLKHHLSNLGNNKGPINE